ncbi:MAG: enoyl-CoA hydratase [Rhodospirillaceae bacterium]|jgi:enoyl-CoA hydratase/carnithine racemase|nr:enoyl-CoA hydratase [Rhodospirillaceae bacterium]MBT5080869.1 enoyl-CoA hydratase [Rhodospirillaceae bacterium]MBT5877859.1 enoyl-CoA hydratase [Rhodospirillaceae bacterium]MBT6592168.1 enoyl-CoA hydratase [Rhodospirillaceae bacterium]MBT6909517.1 enoyl-CoA hydratase [Rhodospirillaceae bacterium]
MDLKVTRSEIADGVGTVFLHRPGRGNSWSKRMNVEYRWLMAQMDDNPDVRVIVVTGTGRQFCVGADFDALDHYKNGKDDYVTSLTDDSMAEPGHGVRPEFDADMAWHWGLRTPVIAAINGACAGVAMALAGFCDLRYGMADTKYTTAAPRLGLPAEYGLAWLLPRMIGLTYAADVLLSGRIIMAGEMKEMGFLNAVYASEDFHAEVAATAKYMAEQVSPLAATTTKRQLYGEIMQHDPGAAVDHSKHLIGELMRSADYREGVAAQQEGRAPKFIMGSEK